jgi:hypothetical protein
MSSPAAASPKSSYTGSKLMDKREVRRELLGVRCGILMACIINPFRSPISVKCFLFLTAPSKSVEHFSARSQKGSVSEVCVVLNIAEW